MVIPAKAKVGENPTIDVKASILRSLALSKPILKRAVLNKPKKNWAPLGAVVRRSTELDKKPKKKRAKKSLKIVCS